MTRPNQITTYTPGWALTDDTASWFWNRAAATYHPSCQILFALTRPFWIRMLGDWEFPREWIDKALAGHQVGEFTLDRRSTSARRSVRVAREAAYMRFDMRWPGGEGVLWLGAHPVSEFLERTLLLVGFGREGEYMDWSGLPRGSAA
jgi:hypothetical protein